MPTPVIMPKFEMAQETGTVLRWLKQDGDPVEKEEPILEIETDKVTMEVEAPAAGTLVGISSQPGDVIPVGEPIAYILADDETWKAPEESREPTAVIAEAPVRATPVAERMAAEHGIDLRTVVGTGPEGRITKEDVAAHIEAESIEPDGKVRAVPAARRLAHELGVPLETVEGSGPAGRIQSADVRRITEERRLRETPIADTDVTAGRPGVRRTVPLVGMWQTMARRMTASVRDAPQFTVSADVDMARAQAVVEDLRTDAADEARVTLTTFLVKACALALRRHPGINASFDENTVVEWAGVNVGVAVAVEKGLVVPVIHHADQLGMREIARRLSELTTRAREGRLQLDDVQAGTFTISNLGMLGVDRFTAILNPPQAAILAVGRIRKRPIVTDDDAIIVRPMAEFTLTADHRVVDGVGAARFLTTVQAFVERPGRLLE